MLLLLTKSSSAVKQKNIYFFEKVATESPFLYIICDKKGRGKIDEREGDGEGGRERVN